MVKVESLRAERKFKKTEIGEIPVDWKVLRVKDVCEKPEYGYTASAVEKPLGPKFLRITDIQDGKVIWNNVPYCNCPDNLKERYIIRSGDILFARTGATTGKSYLIKDCPEAVFASYLIRVAVNEQIDSHFLYSVFNSSIYWRQITQQMGGSAQGGVNASSLANIKIPLPPLSEQKKIAEILSTVDEAIEKSNLVIEKTKELKKGLMQELLTRGIGHKKFKKTEIGKIPVDWEVLKIKDVGEIVTGNTPSTKNMEYYNVDYLWATPADLGTTKYIKSTKKMLSMKGKAVSRLIPKDSILVVCIGSTIGKVGMAPEEMGTNQQINSIICNKLWNPHFVYYWMHKISDLLVSIAGRHAVPIVNKTIFSSLPIAKPSKDEQNTIGILLDSIDDEIGVEIAHKEILKKIKNSLMQVLLTGKVRVI